MSIDTTALPSELLVAPLPLIGFCGLDVVRNVVHKSIWEAFSCNRKADRAAVQFKLLPPNYEYPVAKPKRASYEWYHPKGILKRNWMLKHLHVLPSVVVLFQDMEWNDAHWSEKQLQCAATLQALKNALQERKTRICLVLIQKSAPLPPGEDLLASERAASLTTACGINSKVLFILPHTEHLIGYAIRLESAFLDMAQSYYALMSKSIRTHRDQLTAAHTTLKIRHQFKLGFVAELRQDFSTALKHYTQSYGTLDEIRITDTNCLEIKTIAGFLNYKICRLMFKLKVPRDAINHFISHIEKYKNRIGFKDLLFEHYAWLSTQHSVFAELFCEAIKNGLPALQTQHPGIYFHKAAEYVVKRREAFMQVISAPLSPTESAGTPSLQSSNLMSLYTEFFGIRAVKTGEPMSEQQMNMLIRENEKAFNHSSAIINLLSQAMAQFKIYKCLRFRKKLAIDMADEYCKSNDYAKALTLYSLMLPDYREDKWSSIFSDVLLKTLRCALLSASISDYISCSIEALSLKNNYAQSERIIVLENLWKVLQCEPPVAQSQNATEVRNQWENSLANVKSSIQIDLDKLSKVIEICPSFERVEVKNEEAIHMHLIVKLETDVPVKIRRLEVLLTDGANNFRLQTSQYIPFADLLSMRESRIKDLVSYCNFESDLRLDPNVYYQFLFTTEAQQFLENTQLRVVRTEVHIGTDKLSVLLTKSAEFTRNAFRHHNRCRDLDDNITINPICYIAPTFHLVTQTNIGNQAMLINEYYPVVMTISNPYNVLLQGVALSLSVPDDLRTKVFLATDVSVNRQKLHSSIQIDIGELPMQSSNMASFYIFSLVASTITLNQKIWYTTDVIPPKTCAVLTVNGNATPGGSSDDSPDNTRTLVGTNSAWNAPTLIVSPPVQLECIDGVRLRKTQETVISVKCEEEFKFTGRFYTLNKKPLTQIYRGENFLFRAGIEVQSSSELDILETYFICDHNLVQSTYSFKRKKFTNTYRRGDRVEDVVVLRTNASTDEWVTSTDYERSKLRDATHEMPANIFGRIRNARKHTVGESNKDDGTRGTPPTTSAHPNDESTTTASATQKALNTRLIFNKTLDALQATGHLRGFIKGLVTTDQQQRQQQQQNQTIFGIYCIKWRRSGAAREENESKFAITGLPIVEPPLNVYCTIEERMFVKMPITYKIVLKNPTSKVVHLIATLSISNTDNFICSGHKQLDISIFAFGEKELVYNLCPLCVGWQNLPQITLEYNTQADPNKDETQNSLLGEIVQRSIPKKVFVLPPLKQQNK